MECSKRCVSYISNIIFLSTISNFFLCPYILYFLFRENLMKYIKQIFLLLFQRLQASKTTKFIKSKCFLFCCLQSSTQYMFCTDHAIVRLAQSICSCLLLDLRSIRPRVCVISIHSVAKDPTERLLLVRD